MSFVSNFPDAFANYPLSARTRAFLEGGSFGHFIDGHDVASASDETIPVVEPATGTEFARVTAGAAEDVECAVQSARQAFDDGRWRNVPAYEKEGRLHRLAALLAENRDVMSDLDVLDGGLLRGYSEGVSMFGVGVTGYYAGWPTKMHGSLPINEPDLIVQEAREPIGVCVSIVPWNAPSAIPSAVVPALACGNSVILKPAEQTPLTGALLGRLCCEAGIPPGVVNVVQGRGEIVGAALVRHPLVDAISFVGSCDTGRDIQAAAAPRLKRLGLELGGKSPQIIFGDADIDSAVAAAMSAVWGHSGQVCTAGSRLLVQRNIHDQVVDRIIAASANLIIGSGFDPATQVGPLISAEQLDRVSAYVDIGCSEGAELVLGGKRCGSSGYFHQPTIFTGVNNTMKLAREEIFGPVMAVIPFDEEDEACAIANDTDYGLAAGIWTRDLARAHRLSRKLQVGTVWVNTYQMILPSVSYGGVKQSGYGRSLGAASIDDFTQTKSVWFKI